MNQTSSKPRGLTPAQMAERTGVSIGTLRYYEREGLIRSIRRFVSIQPEYHMLSPARANFETELAQVCQSYQIGVIPYSPLAGGLLTGKYRKDQPLPDSLRAEENAEMRFSAKNWAIIETLIAVAQRTR